MAATVQLRCYWKQLWSMWAITGSWERHVCNLQPSNDYFIKVWFQLSNWFQTKTNYVNFRFGPVKLSSAVGAILVEGPNRRTDFWKRTIQWLFHQNFVLLDHLVWNQWLNLRTKLWWNSHWMVLFQKCVRKSRSPTKMATTVLLRCYWKGPEWLNELGSWIT
jgi:hypothetical protein